MSRYNKKKPDIYISCHNDEIKAWDFNKVEELYELGFESTQRVMNSSNKVSLLEELFVKAKDTLNKLTEFTITK